MNPSLLAQAGIDPAQLAYLEELGDPWLWAKRSRIRLVGSEFSYMGHEFQREPMSIRPPIKTIRKATQATFTESEVLNCIHGCKTGYYKRGVLYLFPTEDEVTDFSSSRWTPLIKDNPETIGQFIRDTNRANLKRIGTAFIFFRAGRLGREIQGQMKSSSKLKSLPADHCVHDEYDEMDTGIDEFVDGRLAKSTVGTKVYIANPTFPDFGISHKFDLSDQRYWHIRCLHCGHETCLDDEDMIPKSGDLLWGLREMADGSVIRACRHCEREIDPRFGRWVPKRPDLSRDHVGYTIGWPSLWWKDPAKLLLAYRTTESMANFIRLGLGRGYVEAENRLTVAEVLECCGLGGIQDSDPGPCYMGVDQGGKDQDLLHIVIGKKHPVQAGQYVYLGVEKGWEELDRLMKSFHVARCVVDGRPNIEDARKFARRFPGLVFLSFTTQDQKGSYRWDEGQFIVNSGRTEAMDASHKELQGQKIILPRKDLDIVQKFARHCNAVAKKLEEDDETGSKRYVYVRLKKEDHFRLANCYEAMARHGAPNLLLPGM